MPPSARKRSLITFFFQLVVITPQINFIGYILPLLKASLHSFWLRKPVVIVAEGLWLRQKPSEDPGVLKGPMHSLMCWSTHSPWAPMLKKQLKKQQDILRETELSGFRAKARVAGVFQKCWQKPLFPYWALPSIQHADTGRLHIWIFTSMSNIVHPVLVIPWDPTPPHFQTHPSSF